MYRTKSETRVAIADSHALVRGAFTALLTAEEDLVVVGEAGDAGEALAVTERELPDVVLIDLDLPGTDALETTRQIFSNPALESVRVIVLSASDGDDALFGALRAGASGFLVKDTGPAELIEAVRAAHLARRSCRAPSPAGSSPRWPLNRIATGRARTSSRS